MKKFIFLPILILCSMVHAQKTSLGFRNVQEKFDPTKNSISVEIELKNLEKYTANDSIVFQIVSETPKIFYKNTRFVEVINPKKYTAPIRFEIPVQLEEVKQQQSFVLRLQKQIPNKNFDISNEFLFVTVKEKEKKLLSLTIEQLDEQSLHVSTSEALDFRFNLILKGGELTKEDSLQLVVGFDDDLEFTHSVTQASEGNNFVFISLKEEDEHYQKIKEVFLKKGEVLLKLKRVEVSEKSNFVSAIEEEKSTLRYKPKDQKAFKNKYDLFLGSNFDLIEQFSASRFFAEISVFLPNLAKNDAGRNVFGLRGGIYKTNTSTRLEQDSTQIIIRDILETTADSVSYATKRVSSVPNVSIENLGLYVQGIYPIITRNNNFNWFVGLHVEVIQRSEKYTFENTDLITLAVDTISLASLSNDPILQRQLTASNSFTRSYVDSYFGVSSPMFYKYAGNANDNDFEVMVNPGFGFGIPGLTNNRENNSIRTYGLTQFHILFGAKNGVVFKIGGEVRKYFNFLQDPIITINFSTRINLEKLFGKS